MITYMCHGSCIPMCAAVDCIPEHYKDSNMNWDHEKCSLYGVVGCPLFRGCLSIEVNNNEGLAELSVISWVSAVEECPLSGVPLY